jgi:hypothetical protein
MWHLAAGTEETREEPLGGYPFLIIADMQYESLQRLYMSVCFILISYPVSNPVSDYCFRKSFIIPFKYSGKYMYHQL